MTSNAPNAFLGPSTTIPTGHAGTVLLHAPFDAAAFDQQLFDESGVVFPGKLARAVDKRRADYLAGRMLVARGFETLGLPPQHVSTGPDRAPVWPAGIVGSISHSRTTCACLLSTNTDLRLGVDVETTLGPDSDKAVRHVALTEAERALVAQNPDLPALIFCAKETLFKALYPTVQAFFGFDCAELSTLPDSTHIQLRLTTALHASLPEGAIFEIRHMQLGDQVMTWLIEDPHDT